MFCGKCGQEMPDTAKFCPKCGAANPKAAQAAAPRPAPAPAPGPIPAPPRPAVPSPSGMQLTDNPFELGLAVCGLLQVILFFILSYGGIARGTFNWLTLFNAVKLMMNPRLGLTFVAVICCLPFLLGLAILLLNLLAMMKIIKEDTVIPIVSVVLAALTLGSHLFIQLIGLRGLAYFIPMYSLGGISTLFILAVTVVQLVMSILALTQKPAKPPVM